MNERKGLMEVRAENGDVRVILQRRDGEDLDVLLAPELAVHLAHQLEWRAADAASQRALGPPKGKP